MEAFHGAYGGDTFEGQGVGGLVGRNAVALGDGYDPAYGVLDAHYPLGSTALVVTLEFVSDVYETASVYDVVRGIEDVVLGESAAVTGLREDVVGAPGDYPAPELRQSLVVDHGAAGARGEDVAGQGEAFVRLHRFGAEFLYHLLDGVGPVVGDHQVRPFLVEETTQVVPDVSEALYRHRPAF